MNPYDKAHELAKALKESQEYKNYIAKKEEISQNAELSAMINDFQDKNMKMQTQQMLTGNADQNIMEQVQSLYQIVMADPLAAEYMQAELVFTKLVSDVYGILGEVIRIEK
ncbi:YlbF family regulator [Anaerovorax sp. IOR16]|uniref:YlbF family regulator n=1 Tax=Anaerovorax sp. IOR16 TaxID=2773458 RepID=UPI0019CFD165|nr:YlbF family regulator [Anaerovorax sp. IOR16]